MTGDTATFLIPDEWASISADQGPGIEVENAQAAVVAAQDRPGA